VKLILGQYQEEDNKSSKNTGQARLPAPFPNTIATAWIGSDIVILFCNVFESAAGVFVFLPKRG